MDFVDLNRCFAPIHKDRDDTLAFGRNWGRRIAGWLEWPEMLKRRRVVLLAEASSGKSEEFRQQQRRLTAEGMFAFFVSIEELADHGLDAALDPSSADALKAWANGTERGYFFLDSVDEARLNRKNFDTALRRLARELGANLSRAHLFISCRVSDWRGQQDRDAVIQLLPSLEAPPSSAKPIEPDRALLGPIFDKNERKSHTNESTEDAEPLLVVQLVPLDTEQRRTLTLAARIADTANFMAGIDQHGLEALAERPGDLLDLIEFWRTHGRFASLEAMTEHAVTRKLAERDKYRPDNGTLTAVQVRHGAERMAAALTLAQTFSIKAPAQDIDPTLAAGAIDSDHVLPDWKEKERNALLRRPAFSPATYGRIRFHHRSTQEYLTASWFDRALAAGAPKNEVWRLFFDERYGVETVVPSMRAAAAWLALKHPDFRDEIIRREPLLLIQNGDPGSLPLQAKRDLLAVYAERHAAGEIADDRMDNRAIWMFAKPELAGSTRQAWHVNSRQDFRRDLLRMVQEAKIADCNDLAREALTHPDSDDHTRIAALAALKACNDAEALAEASVKLVDQPATYAPRVAARFSRLLYPRYLSTGQLLHVIEHRPRPHGESLGGFAADLEALYRACPDAASKEALLAGLADLALRPPFVQDYQRISRRYSEIAASVTSIARLALEAISVGLSPSPGLVRILMAVERADRSEDRDDIVPLSALVGNNASIDRALFWADVEEVRAAVGRPLTSAWQVYFGGHTLWRLSERDLGWLEENLSGREHIDDRRIALSAIVRILLDTNRVDQKLTSLQQAVAGQAVLEQDLADHLVPPPTREASDTERELAARRARAEQETELDKESWRQLRRELAADPGRIRDRARIVSGEALSDLINLTRWLRGHTGIADNKAAVLHWQQLSVGFDPAVADAYRDSMMALWRTTAPERPTRGEGSGVTIKWANTLAFSAIGLEAARPDWLANITREEAVIAAKHACLCEEGYPAWLNSLLDQHVEVILPVVGAELEREWQAVGNDLGDLLHNLVHDQGKIQPALQKALFEIITVSAAPELRNAEQGLSILQRIEMDATMRSHLAHKVTERLGTSYENDRRMLVDLGMLFLVDAAAASDHLVALLESTPEPQRKARTEFALARLFGRDHSLVPAVLATLPISILKKLMLFTFEHVSPRDDVQHEGTYTPDTRDEAESARSAILNALLDRPGEEAFQVVRELAAAGIAGIPATRFRELARRKAERDCEPAPWLPAEILAFEQRHTAPIRTPNDLLRVVMAVLADIQRDLAHGDASSRSLVQAAETEEQVQNWLYEQLSLRANGRFHVHREPEVAEKNKPDLVVSAIGATVEVAIEVKHGGKEAWSVRKLETALTEQLVSDYLRPPTRRRGILIITHHGDRSWRAPEGNTTLTFERLIEHLQRIAASLDSNTTGPVKVNVVGIDTAKK